MKFYLLLLMASTALSQTPNFQTKIHDTTFVNLRDFSSDFVYDMKYATADNFLKSKVYDCGECLLRYETVKALIEANRCFIQTGFKIKIFDCYRPLAVQKKMWKIVPNPVYVADPAKGSIHNRGGAVDITLVDHRGNELDMGTGFDHFGPEAAHSSKAVSAKAIRNRRKLNKTMQRAGFTPFKSEWWHYNLKGASKFPISNTGWNCDQSRQ